MSSNKRVKIFLQRGDRILNFMWADTQSDGSVLMGVYGGTFSSEVKKVFDEEGDHEPGKKFESIKASHAKSSKISFHQSGIYKFSSKIRTRGTDRTTVIGPAFKDIREPRRMLEIFVPEILQVSQKKPRVNKDAVINITDFPEGPLRCTVLCMPCCCADGLDGKQIFDTSIREETISFKHDKFTWSWTMRISRNDEVATTTEFLMFMPGNIKWPQDQE